MCASKRVWICWLCTKDYIGSVYSVTQLIRTLLKGRPVCALYILMASEKETRQIIYFKVILTTGRFYISYRTLHQYNIEIERILRKYNFFSARTTNSFIVYIEVVPKTKIASIKTFFCFYFLSKTACSLRSLYSAQFPWKTFTFTRHLILIHSAPLSKPFQITNK